MTIVSFINDEALLRLGVFASALVSLALLESVWPRRVRVRTRLARWITNFSFVGLGAVIVRALVALGSMLAVPLVAVAAAILAARNGWGVFQWTNLPVWLEVLISVVVLDFAIWLQHWAAHNIQWLWIVHRVHHADTEIDVSTALRFHPIEIGLSMLWKVLWVFALGAPAVAVMIFEIVLNAFAMFNHANLALPQWLDRALRPVIVTPDMHRVHHSIHDDEHRSNFGFNLAIWDRLFGTYVPQPRDGHNAMIIGLSSYQSEQPTKLAWSLKLPFVK